MTRETKVGMLVGICVILLIGIIISDQLTVMQQPGPAELTDFAHDAQNTIAPSYLTDAVGHRESRSQRIAPVPLPAELTGPGQTTAAGRASQAALATLPEPEPYRAPASEPAPMQPAAPQPPQPPQPMQPAQPGRQPRFVEVGRDPHVLPSSSTSERVVLLNRLAEEVAAQPVSTNSAQAEASPGGLGEVIYHEVRQGESLYQIARQYYGNGDYWQMIREANSNLVSPDGRVRQGTRLLIPNKAGLVQVNSGNTAAASRSAGGAATPSRAGGTITVQRGQTLSELAAEHLGSAGRWQALIDANRDQLQDPRDLRAGMKLRLPTDADQSAGPQPPRQGHQNSAAAGYVVQEGDSLTTIAGKALGDRSQFLRIYEANRDVLRDPNAIRPGMVLRIPN